MTTLSRTQPPSAIRAPGHQKSGRLTVSIVIPVYNGAPTVAAAIESALLQEVHWPIEIVVVDDGSTDRTAEILRSFEGRIKVIRQKNKGLASARNTGVAAAAGDLIAFLDADDVWLPKRLTATVEPFYTNPQLVLAYCDVIPVDDNGHPLRTTFIEKDRAYAPTMADLLRGWWPIFPSATTVRRSALLEVGGFPEEFRGASGYEDTYCWLLLREKGPFCFIPEALVRYRLLPYFRRMEKYQPGYKRFARLVRKRYGPAGDELINRTSRVFAAQWEQEGIDALLRGQRAYARRCFQHALSYRYRRRTLFRMIRTFLPDRIALALTKRRRPRSPQPT